MSNEVVICILLIDEKDKLNTFFLSIDNPKQDFDILIPSGKIYMDETYFNAAIRICRKETGLVVKASDLQFLSIDNHNEDYLTITYIIINKWTHDTSISSKGKWLNINELKFSNSYSNLYSKYKTLKENASTIYKPLSIFTYVPSCNLL
jgi:ADP-ribose pyrophosphatase YjhB (NUDIX family)